MEAPRQATLAQDQKPSEEILGLCARADRLVAGHRQRTTRSDWFTGSLRRAQQPDFFRPLQDAIRVMHGCESRHMASFAVRKVRGEQTAWTGTVEEFALVGHPGAAACYAWRYREGSEARTFTLLKQPPVDLPQRAVQFFLLAKEMPRRDAVMGGSS